jgi:lysophospholipase L1-like esterase
LRSKIEDCVGGARTSGAGSSAGRDTFKLSKNETPAMQRSSSITYYCTNVNYISRRPEVCLFTTEAQRTRSKAHCKQVKWLRKREKQVELFGRLRPPARTPFAVLQSTHTQHVPAAMPHALRSRRFTIALAAFACALHTNSLNAQSQPTPTWDTSPQAVAERAAFYSVPGRADLTGPASPLAPGTKIDFFGDSITWLNGYVTNIQNAINTGPGTAGKRIVCVNHGDDGAGVLQVINGEATTNGFGGTIPRPFATTIATDRPNIAVVFIGVNDVWWRGTPVDTFRQGLETIVSQGKTAGVTMVLATLAVNGEKPDGTNPNDAIYDQFAQVTRDVALTTNTTLVDLRTAFIDYEQNNNKWLVSRGGSGYQASGLLTYDGIHPTTAGNVLLSDMIAEGIFRALVPEPTSLTLLICGSLPILLGRSRVRWLAHSAMASCR